MSIEELEIAMDSIKLAIQDYDQRDILEAEDKVLNTVEEVCKTFLLLRDNKIIKEEDKKSTGKANDIIDLFYKLYKNKYPERSIVRNKEKENSTANLFIKSRMTAGEIKRKAAIEECLKLIKIVFEEEDSFDLNRYLDLHMFGQKKMSWIVDKAVQILNKREEACREDVYERRIIAIGENYEGTFGIMDKIEEAELEDGKKER